MILGKSYPLFNLGRDRAAHGYVDRVLAIDPSNELPLYTRENAEFEIFFWVLVTRTTSRRWFSL